MASPSVYEDPYTQADSFNVATNTMKESFAFDATTALTTDASPKSAPASKPDEAVPDTKATAVALAPNPAADIMAQMAALQAQLNTISPDTPSTTPTAVRAIERDPPSKPITLKKLLVEVTKPPVPAAATSVIKPIFHQKRPADQMSSKAGRKSKTPVRIVEKQVVHEKKVSSKPSKKRPMPTNRPSGPPGKPKALKTAPAGVPSHKREPANMSRASFDKYFNKKRPKSSSVGSAGPTGAHSKSPRPDKDVHRHTSAKRKSSKSHKDTKPHKRRARDFVDDDVAVDGSQSEDEDDNEVDDDTDLDGFIVNGDETDDAGAHPEPESKSSVTPFRRRYRRVLAAFITEARHQLGEMKWRPELDRFEPLAGNTIDRVLTSDVYPTLPSLGTHKAVSLQPLQHAFGKTPFFSGKNSRYLSVGDDQYTVCRRGKTVYICVKGGVTLYDAADINKDSFSVYLNLHTPYHCVDTWVVLLATEKGDVKLTSSQRNIASSIALFRSSPEDNITIPGVTDIEDWERSHVPVFSELVNLSADQCLRYDKEVGYAIPWVPLVEDRPPSVAPKKKRQKVATGSGASASAQTPHSDAAMSAVKAVFTGDTVISAINALSAASTRLSDIMSQVHLSTADDPPRANRKRLRPAYEFCEASDDDFEEDNDGPNPIDVDGSEVSDDVGTGSDEEEEEEEDREDVDEDEDEEMTEDDAPRNDRA